ncbi:uncharacterized protein N7511_010017 [Penicillium nucicola]|uniref:uncharacterized protein n=1 Tax=Penicillium nucicola TaxID=1850975 RepID=UPI00254586C2|nr:uncharacterized protein N7511_010017 [Penicillium nucicola]KAJ5748321.1 hypothetical protein N7511_010017 [Penicillium nucicola]
MTLQTILAPASNGNPDFEIVSKPLIETTKMKQANISAGLTALFEENTLAKIIGPAEWYLENNRPPTKFPETVPQTGLSKGVYRCRDAEFWTCGFFPGSLYCLLERMRRYPESSIAKVLGPSSLKNFQFRLVSHLTDLCEEWTAPIYAMAARTDTHDLGFIVQPALQRDWELFGNQKSLSALLQAATSLATRYDERVQAIRSWDSFSNAHHNISSMEDDFLVIIDSLCNLDLLFYAGNYTQNYRLMSIASTHATTLLDTHIRKESVPGRGPCYSTYHAVNFSPPGGGIVKEKLTAQGYSDNSTWARGQSWAILGYAQTFCWTKDRKFLDAAMGLANYFIFRLESSPNVVDEEGRGRYVPLWDFDAPITYTNVGEEKAPLRDVSAAMIAANGMVLLYGQLVAIGKHEAAREYLDYALAITRDTIALAYNRDEMCFGFDRTSGNFRVNLTNGSRFDAILERSTANFNENHADRHWDHGLVYADYYFLELGNRLLDMRLI